MTKTDAEKKRILKRMIHFFENQLIIKDKDGNQIKFKLTKIQRNILEWVWEKNTQNLQIVSNRRWKK